MGHKQTRQQIAALPIMWDAFGGLRVLLITSRETRRWIIPKGWPMKGVKDWDAAAIEAREEAGVLGRVQHDPIGRYQYFKRFPDRFELVSVTVYPLFVHRELDRWPEQKQRQTVWFGPRVAAGHIDEPDLADIIGCLAENTIGHDLHAAASIR